jgi:hypothetical protein
MRAWIEELDDDHDVHVHAASYSDLKLLADTCAEMRSAGMGNGKDEKLAMSCDGWTIMEWCNRKGVLWQNFWSGPDHKELQNRFLNDPDNAAFRIWTGRV